MYNVEAFVKTAKTEMYNSQLCDDVFYSDQLNQTFDFNPKVFFGG